MTSFAFKASNHNTTKRKLTATIQPWYYQKYQKQLYPVPPVIRAHKLIGDLSGRSTDTVPT